LYTSGSSFGRFLGGLVFDMAGSCCPALIGAAVTLVVAVALINRLGVCANPLRRDVVPNLAAELAV
jgi:hypothetical protein